MKKKETSHKHLRRTTKKRECQVKGCKEPYRAKGYCATHYKMWRDGEFGKSRYQVCSKEGCRKAMAKEGLCEQHWAEKRNPGAGAAAPAPAAPATPPAAT